MGLLLVITFTFLFGLFVNALFLGWLSNYLYGQVQEWVLFVSVAAGIILASLAGRYYDEREWYRARRR